MKILFVVSSFPKLSETFILNQITGLIDLGVDVEILAFQPIYNIENHPTVAQYHLLEKVHYVNLPQSYLKRLAVGLKICLQHPKQALQQLNILKNGWYALTLRSLSLLPKMGNLDPSYDVIISHYGPNGVVVEQMKQAGFWPNSQHYTFFHGYDLTAFRRRWGHKPYQILVQSDCQIRAISHYFKKQLSDLGIPDARLAVHHMGIDCEKIKPEKSIIKSPKTLSLVTVGRLVEKKGMDQAILTLAALKQRAITAELTIIGGGALSAQLHALVHALKLDAYVYFMGEQDQIVVQKVIQAADVVILMSHISGQGDMEGIPVVLMEAMAQAKPVLSTYHSGIPELIQSEENGWLVPVDDYQAAADQLKIIATNLAQIEPIRKAARLKIETDFNNRVLNQQLYDELSARTCYAK
ncbi:glycosyltransferase [Latilactobacillus graminis]|uniref:Glycosyl transferase family 1 domain-containing protein n=2 Tax=Latilactobacillus graminis TaxID=60519 RepID=A0AA89I451_9LACO|nr:glycosyltransferase [Latilactobacillus graminis]KRM21201.1 hypothetical protein FC90_GL001738 [Latilactobacillus graminis DSM 20719]